MYSRDEIVEILAKDNADEIFHLVDETGKNFVGDEVHLRGLIEFLTFVKEIANIVDYNLEIKRLKDIV